MRNRLSATNGLSKIFRRKLHNLKKLGSKYRLQPEIKAHKKIKTYGLFNKLFKPLKTISRKSFKV